MDFKADTLHQLSTKAATLAQKNAFLGFDGFVDTIVAPVALRSGGGEAFEQIPTLTEFGRRVAAAAGKSTNIELYPRMDKLGGNGPIMALALSAAGASVQYVGNLGRPNLHPVFADFARRANVTSVAEPGKTTAIEFSDGKLMLGITAPLEEVTFARIVETVGADALHAALSRADLIALVNWTMLPHMTAIFTEFVERLLPKLPKRDRLFFFDLADPEKRSDADLSAALTTISNFQKHGRAVLGLNLKEAQHVARLLGIAADRVDEAGLRQLAHKIRALLQIHCVVVHPRESAACATAEGESWVPGPYCEKPVITTGAGDHFNSGFMAGLLMGLTPTAALTLGVCTSGHYVRTAVSPSLENLRTFIATWK